jgi:hypothetical protein
MARNEVEDSVRIAVEMPPRGEVERRWWRIVQPPPSVAFSLRGRIGAALGPLVDVAMREFSRAVDPQAEEDLESDVQTMGDAMALRAFRNARCGRPIASAAALVGQGVEAKAGDVAGVLTVVATFVARHTGSRIDAPVLLGVHERNTANDPDALGFKWPGPSLLHRLLLDSRLQFGGSGEKWRTPSGIAGENHPGAALADAVNRGSVGGFVAALDDLVAGPDELTLLYTWALLHLWRPF